MSSDDLKARNSEGGINFFFIANACLVAIYQYWEDHYRRSIAHCFKRQKNEIKAPIFGDLRILRISIIHNNRKAIPEIKDCEILKWFNEGDLIQLSREKFDQMIDEILECLLQFEANPNQFIE